MLHPTAAKFLIPRAISETRVPAPRLIHPTNVTVASCLAADVREAVRRREPGSHRADLEAAEGEDTGDHR